MKNKTPAVRLPKNSPARGFVLGLMSGTSCDGLTICALQPQPFQLLCFKNYRYLPALQKHLLQAKDLRAAQLSELNFELGQLYAQKARAFLKWARLPQSRLLCIGSHGQTVYHGPADPTANTLQIGEPAFLSAAFGVPVVAHFREKDMALGGQGAPLIPFFDEYIFGQGQPNILLNLGGIANLSVVGKGIKTRGFDCGPANTLMDLACARFLGKPYDKDGRLAAQGKADVKLVQKLLTQPFFRQKPPKSLDKNDFAENYLCRHFNAFGPLRAADLLASLNLFTAAAVADAIKRFVPARARRQIIVSGGGAYNKTLLQNIQRLSALPVITSEAAGLNPQAKEAAAFGLMAYLALQGKSNHCARATGAKENTILGQVIL